MRLDALALAGIATILVSGCAKSGPTPVVENAAIGRLIDSARTAGLPTKPLLSKVVEGHAKNASDDSILRAVRAQVREEERAQKRP